MLDDAEAPQAQGHLRMGLARVLRMAGKHAEAEQIARQALEFYERKGDRSSVTSACVPVRSVIATTRRVESSSRTQLCERVVGRVLVGLAERRVVEHHLDERLDRAAQHDHRLADVDQLGRAFADAVDSRSGGASTGRRRASPCRRGRR